MNFCSLYLKPCATGPFLLNILLVRIFLVYSFVRCLNALLINVVIFELIYFGTTNKALLCFFRLFFNFWYCLSLSPLDHGFHLFDLPSNLYFLNLQLSTKSFSYDIFFRLFMKLCSFFIRNVSVVQINTMSYQIR